ncbi:hypothetical protein ZOSMA_48G00380 [Zostera marina]|uniref:DUF3741 domain-containing protein n=1 Tax=Zostera marina TaxID=29655 RepID=A0A0K9NZI6_ZOSMR|nr:hypothetical protein ZOSMA_48G00380 [Zostera marina]
MVDLSLKPPLPPSQTLTAERKMKMAPGRLREDQDNLERQVGCINGFFHLFDKHQIPPGKRIYSTKRLPSSSSSSSSPAATSPSPSEKSQLSSMSSSKYSPPTPPATRSSRTLPLPLFENKDGAKTSWKLREAPRLSLDSRLLETKRKLFPPDIRTTPMSTGNDQDKQIGSPSVIARLMGLDPLPKSESGGTDEGCCGAPQLKRSASESRATKEFLQYPFLHLEKGSQEIKSDPAKFNTGSTIPSQCSQMRDYSGVQKKKPSSFNPQEFFTEPTMKFGSDVYHDGGDATENLYVEIEKSLRIPAVGKDLDSLKQILEALRLKGLLHSNPYPIHQLRNQTFDQHRQKHHSPIVLMKPASSSILVELSPPRRNCKVRKSAQEVSDRRGRTSSIGSMSPNSPAKVKKANIQISSPRQQSPRSRSSPKRSTPPSPSDRLNRPPRIKKTSTKQYSNDEVQFPCKQIPKFLRRQFIYIFLRDLYLDLANEDRGGVPLRK